MTAAVLAATVWASAGSGEANVTIRVGVMADTITNYIPAVGRELGIFEKYGLDIRDQTFSAGINTVDALTFGQLDLGQAADFAVLNRIGSTGKSDLRIFTRFAKSLPDSQRFFVNDDEVKSPSDLAGKSITLRKGSVDEFWVAQLLEQNGVAAESVKLLPVSSYQEGVALVQTGKATGMWATGKAVGLLRETPGVREIADLATINAPTITLLLSTQKFLDENEEAVVSYIKAADEILTYIADHPEETAEIVNKAINAPKDQVLVNIKVYDIGIGFSQEDLDALDDINKWGLSSGVIKTPYEVRDYVDTDALEDALPDRVTYK
jgi:NitT/TauT family transport system substrate-binding protein